MEKIRHHHISGYQITAVQQRRLRTLIVCFGDSRAAGTEGSGFGAQISLGLRRGLSMLFVTPKSECWYQGADALWSHLADWVERAQRVIVIGSEMGAVGAMRMAERMRVDDALLFSPVAELDPRKGACDWRFDEAFARAKAFTPVTRHGAGSYMVFYDPGSVERRHLDALHLPQERLVRVPMPGTLGRAMHMLSCFPLWEQILNARINQGPIPHLRPALRDLRRATPGYLEAVFYRNLSARPAVSDWALARMRAASIAPRRLRRLQSARDHAA